VPIYVYTCRACGARAEVFARRRDATPPEACARCGTAGLAQAPAPFALHRTLRSTLDNLDPIYHKRIDDAIARTPEADPMRLLAKLTPFSAAEDPGDPITF